MNIIATFATLFRNSVVEMTQISKRQLGKQLQRQVYQTFWSAIAKLTKEQEVSLFFSEFFTRNERVNFAKRLAIGILLYKGYDWRSIRDLLKVSEGTIAKMTGKVDGDGLQLLFDKFEKEEKWQKFWQDLAKTYLTVTHPEKVARLGMEGVERIYFPKKKKTLL